MCTNPQKIIVNGEEVTVKCGKCQTCRKNKYQEWAIKLINEAKYHKKSCFITLTFDNKILLDKRQKAYKYGANPNFIYNINNSKKYFQDFMKRLRKHYEGTRITFYHVGEYGEKTHRPHHHALLFGIDFKEDRIQMPKSKSGHTQYFSKTLSEIWACGLVSVEDINPNNIIYISQYSLKKFKKNEENPKYKPIQSFSNRSKMNSKWVRRNPEEIIKGYIEDTDGKKYRVPQSYINNLKNSEEKRYKEAYRYYEETMQEYFTNHTHNDMIIQQKIKEIIAEKRKKDRGKPRDF